MWTVHTAHKVLSGNQLQLEIWLGRLLTKIHTEDLAVKLKGEILSLHPDPADQWPFGHDKIVVTIGSKIRVEEGSNSIDVLSIYIFEHLISIYVTVVLSSLSIYVTQFCVNIWTMTKQRIVITQLILYSISCWRWQHCVREATRIQ